MSTVIVVIIVLASIAGAFVLFHVSAKKRVLTHMQGAVAMVSVGLYNRLSNEYADALPVDDAKCLAASVVNSLFGYPQSDFGEQHEDLVAEKVSLLASLPVSTRQVITDALRAQAQIDFCKGMPPTSRAEWTQHGELSISGNIVADALNKGILVKGGAAPSYDDFPRVARQFLDDSSPARPPRTA